MVISKLFEKIILQQLSNHLSANILLHPFQSAYHSNHSTQTTLLQPVNDLLLASDSGNVWLFTLLDLFAAFDTTDHPIHLIHLEYTFGIYSIAFAWFKSYLYDWFQTVSFNNTQFDPVNSSVVSLKVLSLGLFLSPCVLPLWLPSSVITT